MILRRMDTEYEYDGISWCKYPTVQDVNSFFHSVHGVISEDQPCADEDADFRRMSWSAFLTYFKRREKPPLLNELLMRCFSVNAEYRNDYIDQTSYDKYTKDVSLSCNGVTIEEIPLLATLENVTIIVLARNQTLVIAPNFDLIGDYPQINKNCLREVVICYEGGSFSRLRISNPRPEVSETILSDTNSDTEILNENPENLKLEKITYDKLGDGGAEGILYQVDLLTLFLLKGLKKVKQWRLSTENIEAGKFDDLIFEYIPKKKDFLLQAKHRKVKAKNKITLSDLFSTNSKHDDFSLPKYFFTYLEIRNKFKIESVIICTNVDIKESDKTIVCYENIEEDDMIYFRGTGACCYTFSYDIIPELEKGAKEYWEKNLQKKNIATDVITKSNIRSFLSSLRFLANFGNAVSLDKIIEEYVLDLTEYYDNLDPKTSIRYIHRKMFDWLKTEKGKYWTDVNAKAFFSDLISHRYCEKLRNFNVSFKLYDIELNGPCRILHVIPQQQEYILTAMRIHQVIRKEEDKMLFLNPDRPLSIQQQMLSSFRLEHYTHLVVIRTSNNDGLIQNCAEINDIIRESKEYKKLVIISRENDEFARHIQAANCPLFKSKRETILFSDFSELTQAKLMKTKIVDFQGKEMNLEQFLCDNEYYNRDDIITPEIIVKLMKREAIIVGHQIKHSEEYIENFYIARTFLFSEEKIRRVVNESEDKVVVISDTAGMGKSTVLTQLAMTIKANNHHLWVIRIDLNSYTKFFSECINANRYLIDLEELLNSAESTNLKTSFETKIFRMKGKIVLMLDGLDEISPYYTDLVMNLLASCRNQINISHIFITTRPNIQNIIEKRLSVKSVSLEPFSRRNQITFLKEYWTQKLKIENIARCELYAEYLVGKIAQWLSDGYWKRSEIFIGVPLQTKMVADIFQENSQDYEWESCSEFQKSPHKEPILPHKMNLIKLYEMFIEAKRYIFMDVKYKGDANALTTDLLIRSFNNCQNFHKKLALVVLFDNEKCRLFKDYRNKDTNLEDTLKLGIVQETNKNLHFIHRTFAEFYVAKCLITELDNTAEAYLDFLFKDLLTRKENNVIRAFFDNFLETEFKSQTINLCEHKQEFFNNLTASSKRNSKYRTFLDTLIAENCREIIKFFLRHSQLNDILRFTYENGEQILHIGAKNDDVCLIEFLDAQKIDLNVKDKDGNTAAHCAAIEGNLNTIECLLNKKANINIINNRGQTPLDCAVIANHKDIVEYLTDDKLFHISTDEELASHYRINLLTLLVLKGLQNVKHWRLSREKLEDGKCASFIFENIPKQQVILFQTIHRNHDKRITCNDLFSTDSKNAEFSIFKYFFIYLEMRKKFKIDSIIIYTNRQIENIDTSMLSKKLINKSDTLYFTETEACCYMINDHIVSDLERKGKSYEENLKQEKIISEVEMKFFLKNLQIITNLGSASNVNKVIENALADLTVYSSNLHMKTLRRYVHKKMFDWFTNKDTPNCITELDVQAFFAEHRSQNYCDMLRKRNITFKCCDIELKDSRRILHVVPQQHYILSVIKIYQMVQKDENKILFANPEDNSDIHQQFISAFALPHYTTLVLTRMSTCDELIDKCSEIKDIISKSIYKKLIIISQDNDDFAKEIEKHCESLFTTQQDTTLFSDLSALSQTNLQNEIIIFQGADVVLKDLLGDMPDHVRDQIIDPDAIVQLTNGQKSLIGLEVKHAEENIEHFYISRFFLSPEGKISDVHINNRAEKIISISDIPGSGKTTILSKIAMDLKRNNLHLWVVKIDLICYGKILEQCLEEKRTEVDLEDFLNCVESTKLATPLEKTIFRMKGKLVLLFDGLDEIRSDYLEIVVNLLKAARKKQNVLKIYITMRSSVQRYFETKLDVKSLTLENFSPKDQIDFLTKYWTKQMRSKDGEMCEMYAEALIKKSSNWFSQIHENFIGTALQMRILAEIFHESEGYNKFQKSELGLAEFPHEINLATLYDTFVDKQRHIYMNNKFGIVTNTRGTKLFLEFMEYEIYHKKLALTLSFNPEICSLFTVYRYNTVTLDNTLEMGIVQKTNNQLHFIHRTLLEFYAAKCLMTELDNNNETYLEFLVKDILRKNEYKSLRVFFEKSLEMHFALETLNVSEELQTFLDDFTASPERKFKYKTFLHTLAEESCIETIKLMLKHVKLADILHFKYENEYTMLHIAAINDEVCLVKFLHKRSPYLDIQDKDGNSAIHCAASEGNLNVVKCLVNRKADIFIKNDTEQTPLDCARSRDHQDIVEYLTSQEAEQSNSENSGAGSLFVVELLTLFLLNGLTNGSQRWRLSTKNKTSRKFDDVVFEFMRKNIFLAARWSRNENKKIGTEELFNAKNSGFFLPTYFVEYLRIRKHVRFKSVIICTNIDIADDIKDKFHRESMEDMEYFPRVEASCYSLNLAFFPEMVAITNDYFNKRKIKNDNLIEKLEVFLENLKFIVNVGNKKGLREVIETTISEMEEYSSNLDTKTSANYLSRRIYNWSKSKLGTYLTINHAKGFFADLRSRNYCEMLRKFDISFNPYDIGLKDSHKILHITCEQAYLLNLLRLYQRIIKENNKILIINPEEQLNNQKLILRAFQLLDYDTLIVIRTCNGDNLIQECAGLNSTLQGDVKKKLIIFSQESDKFVREIEEANKSMFKRRKETILFSDLSHLSRAKLIKMKNIRFQGTDTDLDEFISNVVDVEWDEFVDLRTIVSLINNEKIIVGNEVKYSEKYITSFYIPRTFQCTEEKMCEVVKNGNEKVVLIPDITGMGKSTVMAQIAVAIKWNNPHLWVIQVDLNNYANFLEQTLKKEREQVDLEEFLNSFEPTMLKTSFETKIFRMRRNVVLIFDGLDEISSEYTDIVIDLFQLCKHQPNISNILIATQPSIQRFLETKLSSMSFTLEPFSPKDQIDFLIIYWGRRLSIENTGRFERYAEILVQQMTRWFSEQHRRRGGMFVGTPLLMKIIADVFQESFNNHVWQGCQDFQISSNDDPKLPAEMEFVELYEIFIEKKEYIFLNDTGNSEKLNTCQSDLKKLALDILLASEKRFIFTEYLSQFTDMKSTEKLGLVRRTNDQLHFIHRTFAEFYMAKCLLTEVHNENELLLKFLLKDLLRKPEHRVIRAFFDKFLETEYDTQSITLSKHLQTLFTDCTSSNRQRTFKHKSFIYTLIEEGCFETIRFFLRHSRLNYILSFKYENGETMSHISAKNDDVHLIQLLYNLNLDINIQDHAGNTALHCASEYGSVNVLEYLLKVKVDVNTKNGTGRTALNCAVLKNHEEIVRYLLNGGGNSEIRDNHGLAAIHYAILKSPSLLDLLITANVDINLADSKGRTALHLAIDKGDLRSCEILVKHGADVNAKDQQSVTPLHVAVDKENVKIINFLITYRAEYPITDEHIRTVLRLSAEKGNSTIFKILLKDYVNRCPLDKDSIFWSCLHTAAAYGYLKIVKFLLPKFLPVAYNDTDNDGRTPLHCAVRNGHFKTVKFLVRQGVNVNICDIRGRTALYEAVIEGHVKVVEFLVKHGANVNCKSDGNQTVLDLAVFLTNEQDDCYGNILSILQSRISHENAVTGSESSKTATKPINKGNNKKRK